METILLLGGRAPATLELARGFYRAGHRVIVADSVSLTLTGASRTVAKAYTLPPPAQALDAFAGELNALIKREGITFLLPTCEELFHVARICDQLPSACRVFVPPLTHLHHVHHKGVFVEKAKGDGLEVPETYTIENQTGLHPFLENSREWVFKPAYSRFAGQTLIRPTPQGVLDSVYPNNVQPWVVQQFIPGRQICTYSIAQNGRLTAHCAYPTEWTAGQGATVAFRNIDHPASRAWVEQFAAKSQWTGQIAFDFIEQANGDVTAIECNPRATSGVHLLANHPHFVRAYLDADISCVTPAPHTGAMVGGGMLFYGLPTLRNWKQWQAWRDAFTNSRDVVWRGDDPKPWLWQWLALGMFVGRALRLGITPLEATTWDIEWNGEM